MTFFPNLHRRALEADGYVVLDPDEPRFTIDSAKAYLRCTGHVVIRARVPQLPRVGECWVPTRKSSILNCVHPRTVRSVGLDAMSYVMMSDDLSVTISLRTWHRWVQRVRAVMA